MALYAIGDLHLSLSVNKPMDRFGEVWKNHMKKIQRHWKRRIQEEDTVVITGDHSWGRKLTECRLDLEWIASLPGKKILLRGNHDMFWEAKKTWRLNEEFAGRLSFLQDNFYTYQDYALVGTKGYCYEGRDTEEHFLKIREREMARLWDSFDQARAAGYQKYLMFLHYPPTSIGEMESPFTLMAEGYGVEQVVYSHCHGTERFYDSFQGEVNGILYRLVSSDFLKFKPERILP
ncbi:metallophosphoesterase [Lachnospiraceae bacterium 29-84]